MRGEQLGVVTNWPPSLEAALQRWGTISPKAPCLTTMDTNGKPLYILTYGEHSELFLLLYILYSACSKCINIEWKKPCNDAPVPFVSRVWQLWSCWCLSMGCWDVMVWFISDRGKEPSRYTHGITDYKLKPPFKEKCILGQILLKINVQIHCPWISPRLCSAKA